MKAVSSRARVKGSRGAIFELTGAGSLDSVRDDSVARASPGLTSSTTRRMFGLAALAVFATSGFGGRGTAQIQEREKRSPERSNPEVEVINYTSIPSWVPDSLPPFWIPDSTAIERAEH
jgi:hypothetical protein